MTIFEVPSREMTQFAQFFGGIVSADILRTDPSRCLAHRFISSLLDRYRGALSPSGEAFAPEFQTFLGQRQNAVCSIPSNHILIGYDEGLKALITEICVAVTLLKEDPAAFSERIDGFQFIGNRQWHAIGHGNSWNQSRWEALRDSLPFDDKTKLEHFCMTNSMLLFVLLHEFAHAQLGHAHVFSRGSLDLFLGETESATTQVDSRWPMLAEISADFTALCLLLGNITMTDGNPYELRANPPLAQTYEEIIIGLCLLESCWFVNGLCARGFDYYSESTRPFNHNYVFDGAHPVGPDRIANILSCASEMRQSGYVTDEFQMAMINAFKFIADVVAPRVPEIHAAAQVISHVEFYFNRALELFRETHDTIYQDFSRACEPYKVVPVR